jgi:hypothetical protein
VKRGGERGQSNRAESGHLRKRDGAACRSVFVGDDELER